ncbi:MAG: DUF4886 domain-containing protein [Pseudomonadota bacterium]
MKTTKSLVSTVAFLLIGLAEPACAAEPVAAAPAVERLENEAPERVLFVGNSYLYYNDSVHNHVRRIAEDVGPRGVYRYKSATIGGARLSHHHIDSLLEPGRLGIDEAFDLVILQGGSAEPLSEDSRAQFRESAVQMAKKIRATGAEVALYMTHAYVEPDRRYAPNLIDTIAPTYLSVGNALDALVIPVGIAFERAYEQRPEIELHKPFDGSHPSILGTYLAACVVYGSVYGNAVSGIAYDYYGAVSEADAAFLQGIADETVREFFGRD